jgi:hypothetical protein
MSEDRLRVDVVHLRIGRWRCAVHAADIISVGYWDGGVDDEGDPDSTVQVFIRGADDTVTVNNTAEEIEGWMRDR